MKNISIKEVFENTVKKSGNNIAYTYFNKNKLIEVRYSEFYNDVVKLGTYINHLKLKNKRIAIIGKNSYEWALSYMAVVCGGFIVVPFDKELTSYEISTYLKRANIDCIIYSNEIEDKVLEGCKKLKIKKISFFESDKTISISEIIQKKFNSADLEEYCNIEIDPNELTALLFTSGTTKIPKIVMLSQNNIINDVIMCNNAFDLTEKDKFFSLLPLHHMYECTAGFLLPIYLGASVHYIRGFRYIKNELLLSNPTIILCVPRVIETFYDIITKEIRNKKLDKVVNFLITLTNTMFKNNYKIKKKIFTQIHKNFGKNFRFFICGGAPMNIEIAKYMSKLGFRIFEGYGITECSPIVSVNNFDFNKLGSTGKVFYGLKVKIINPDSNGVGEIYVKGPTVMLGYYKNYKLNKRVFKNGYFNTEDLGYIDDEGYLFIVGRTKNLILGPNGENIFPEEIENLLLQNNIIKEVIVSGKTTRNNINLSADIVVNNEYLKENNISKKDLPIIIQEIIDETNKKIVFFKRINSFNIMNHEFEKTSTLKIKR